MSNPSYKPIWQYIGHGDGKGTLHVVTMTDDALPETEITTWSIDHVGYLVSQKDRGIAGYSWLGPMSEFKKQFVRRHG